MVGMSLLVMLYSFKMDFFTKQLIPSSLKVMLYSPTDSSIFRSITSLNKLIESVTRLILMSIVVTSIL